MHKRLLATTIAMLSLLLVAPHSFVAQEVSNVATRNVRNTADIEPTPQPDSGRTSRGGSFGWTGVDRGVGGRTNALPAVTGDPAEGNYVGDQGYYDPNAGYDGGYTDYQLPTMSDDDYLAGDSAYQAQLAALLKAGADQEADFTAQGSKYNVDYGDALKGLGWTADDPATADINEGVWNLQDQNTASGRAYTNQQNDFASRGTLQSSGYGTALDNLMRSLNDQLGGINTGKQSFFDDLTRNQTSAKNENTLSQQQARAEALARRAAGVGVVGAV